MSTATEVLAFYSRCSVVYFIQAKMGGLIKIGTSVNLAGRFREIQRMSPLELRVLATIQGSYEMENSLHKQFSQFRKHGEWFEPHESLLEFIKVNASEYTEILNLGTEERVLIGDEFNYLQPAYLVKRNNEQVVIPVTLLTNEEIESKVAELNQMGGNCYGHADELTCYKNERRATA